MYCNDSLIPTYKDKERRERFSSNYFANLFHGLAFRYTSGEPQTLKYRLQ